MTWLYKTPKTPVEIFGLTFQNRVGIAAGYDKDGIAWQGLSCLGFGHVEIGTVTPQPQSGNPKPRVFRLIEDRALINRMGFPGKGMDYVKNQLAGKKRPKGLVLGVNLGMNNTTPIEMAAVDYQQLICTFASHADYLVINISSPNTVGLRRLQAKELMDKLLMQLNQVRVDQQTVLNRQIPLCVKLAPDLTDPELDDALSVIQNREIDGVIATNTTVTRVGLKSKNAREVGGLSGIPLRRLSTQMVRKIHQRTRGQIPIIGVGGVMTVDDVKEKLDAGAALVQVYTGLVYEGPGLGNRINRGLGGF
jgi:dihydroorotate dehydrogenase